jgi:hypothetical protein
VYVRVATFRGAPDDIVRGLDLYEEHALPWAREATGYRGWALFLDREGGSALALTFWESEQDARENEPAAQQFRDQIGSGTGVDVTDVTFFDVLRLSELPQVE